MDKIEVNAERPVTVDLRYKICKRGASWMPFKLVGNKWLPLLPDYSLLTSAVGALESEISHDVRKV